MTSLEFSNEFEILYNNIMSNQSPGIDEYEKSLFLTKAQLELVKNYFNPKGTKYQEGYDDSAKRQYDFSVLNTVKKYREVINGNNINDIQFTLSNDNDNSVIVHNKQDGSIDNKFNRYKYKTPSDFLFFINEEAYVERVIGLSNIKLQSAAIVTPINYNEYTTLRGDIYKYPVNKNECWRLITNRNNENIEIIAPYNHKIVAYTIRYVRIPRPIILTDIMTEYGTTINGEGNTLDPVCELPEAMHPEIVQRAVELAKAAYRTGETEVITQIGQRTE